MSSIYYLIYNVHASRLNNWIGLKFRFEWSSYQSRLFGGNLISVDSLSSFVSNAVRKSSPQRHLSLDKTPRSTRLGRILLFVRLEPPLTVLCFARLDGLHYMSLIKMPSTGSDGNTRDDNVDVPISKSNPPSGFFSCGRTFFHQKCDQLQNLFGALMASC